jgi:beta-mannanase
MTKGYSSYYPGSSYVDVVSLDPRVKNYPSTTDYTTLAGIAGSKPMSPAEVGVLPTAAQLAAQSKCLDVSGASAANGTKIQLYTCDANGTAQAWTTGGGTLQALGKCLDVAAAGTADGTKVQLYDCNGTGAQQWTYNSSAQTLVNPASGKCLDAAGQSSADGTQIQIWTCTGNANQKWSLPA